MAQIQLLDTRHLATQAKEQSKLVTPETREPEFLGADFERTASASVVESKQFARHVPLPRAFGKDGCCVPADLLYATDFGKLREDSNPH